MEDYMKSNQERWNELVAIHAASSSYDLEGFKKGQIRIRAIEQEEVGDVSGKTLLHLQCHFGIDTLSWARLGAKVTGIDFSDQAIGLARSVGKELGIDATFVLSSVYDLPNVLDATDQFDIVYTSHGVLGWLPDLQPWAKVIAHYLKPGGFFYIAEIHPFAWIFDDEGSSDFKPKYSYFTKEPIVSIVENTYADRSAKVQHTTEYGWNHTFSEILCSLISAGLSIDFLHEFPFCAWECFPNMREDEDAWCRMIEPDKANLLPLAFSLKATKM